MRGEGKATSMAKYPDALALGGKTGGANTVETTVAETTTSITNESFNLEKNQNAESSVGPRLALGVALRIVLKSSSHIYIYTYT